MRVSFSLPGSLTFYLALFLFIIGLYLVYPSRFLVQGPFEMSYWTFLFPMETLTLACILWIQMKGITQDFPYVSCRNNVILCALCVCVCVSCVANVHICFVVAFLSHS